MFVLNDKSASKLLIEERANKEIVICAPHHTVGGVKFMPCPDHEDGDENTGFIAREVAERLNACSIIACNYHIDVNKDLNTEYSLQIIKWAPKYLFEIHGHGGKGGKKPGQDTVEISSGKMEKNEFSKRFAENFQLKILKNDKLNGYKICGDFEKIYFKATNALTITDNRWLPFHIELPPSLRINTENNLPEFITDFNEILIETINEICV